ncbi:MAG: hypothetical protein DWQ44_02115 [Bacteroidetes bacterium]|nr:MAG: hypothetical protein DWQ33_05845 [Bacteroidota bacterium]REK04770.1 MAG: hypothetical protein DWQ39_06010 [Bacteroidota bacterium]REK36244.1 MAG: hypothetical protein DWQ44_02115 [Bacteroidota bacterium]REK51094.1 MAG: hypothetical protein DWQ48_03110 [Bacteroidota bacterium]
MNYQPMLEFEIITSGTSSSIAQADSAAVASSTQSSIIKTLLYFGLFHHPLQVDEIIEYSNLSQLNHEKVQQSLKDLVSKGLVSQSGPWYYIQGDESIIKRRIEGEVLAKKLFSKAKFFSKIISRFPFVRGIYLSGSISKYYMDNKSDIDYFIITSSNRLWICRTMLIFFKKVFLLNSKKFFCLNYFITEDNLEIPDRNIFTATEIIHLIPIFNESLFQKFSECNCWIKEYYPELKKREERLVIPQGGFFLTRITEKFLSGKAGDKLEDFFLRATTSWRRSKFRHFDEMRFNQRMRSDKNSSKHHPLGYQERVLEAFSQSITQFEVNNGIKISRL